MKLISPYVPDPPKPTPTLEVLQAEKLCALEERVDQLLSRVAFLEQMIARSLIDSRDDSN